MSMTSTEKEKEIANKIVDIIEESELSFMSLIGMLEVIKTTLIESTGKKSS